MAAEKKETKTQPRAYIVYTRDGEKLEKFAKVMGTTPKAAISMAAKTNDMEGDFIVIAEKAHTAVSVAVETKKSVSVDVK